MVDQVDPFGYIVTVDHPDTQATLLRKFLLVKIRDVAFSQITGDLLPKSTYSQSDSNIVTPIGAIVKKQKMIMNPAFLFSPLQSPCIAKKIIELAWVHSSIAEELFKMRMRNVLRDMSSHFLSIAQIDPDHQYA